MADVFRRVYQPLTDLQKAWMDDVKEKAEILLSSMESPLEPGERSERARLIAVAKTQLELSVMAAVKGITS